MSIRETFLSVAEQIISMAISIAQFVMRKAAQFIVIAWEWFLSLPVIEKLIIINGIPAMITAVLPVARFEIFESVYGVNNPLAHYMVIIGLFMFGSIFIRHLRWTVFFRVGICIYYIAWAIYILFADGQITKADQYTVTPYYVLNFIVPSVYAALATLSYFRER